MNTPLCIIDMQPFFEKTASIALPGTLREVRSAKQRNAPIILVEYADLGPSYDEILELLDPYPHTIRVTKDNDGGGMEVIETASEHGVNLNQRIRVCGVNRSFCVYSTLHEIKMQSEHFEVEVPVYASWCSNPDTGIELLGGLGCILVGT